MTCADNGGGCVAGEAGAGAIKNCVACAWPVFDDYASTASTGGSICFGRVVTMGAGTPQPFQ